MARERLVTRTIESHKYTLLGVKRDAMTETSTITITTGITTEKELKKMCISECENAGLLFTTIIASEVVEKLYGMSEVEFMKYAKELPPR